MAQLFNIKFKIIKYKKNNMDQQMLIVVGVVLALLIIMILLFSGVFTSHYLISTKNKLPIWASGTSGNNRGCFVIMHSNNSLVVHDKQNATLWSSQTWGKGVLGTADLVLQDDGNLVIYDSAGTALWASNTGT